MWSPLPGLGAVDILCNLGWGDLSDLLQYHIGGMGGVGGWGVGSVDKHCLSQHLIFCLDLFLIPIHYLIFDTTCQTKNKHKQIVSR